MKQNNMKNKMLIIGLIGASTLFTGCNMGNFLGWDQLPQGQYYVTISNVNETGGLLGGCDDILVVSENTMAQVNSNGNIRIGGSPYSSTVVNLDSNPCFNQSDNLFGTTNNIQFSNCKSSNGPIGQYQMNANLTVINPDDKSSICTADIQFQQFNNI